MAFEALGGPFGGSSRKRNWRHGEPGTAPEAPEVALGAARQAAEVLRCRCGLRWPKGARRGLQTALRKALKCVEIALRRGELLRMMAKSSIEMNIFHHNLLLSRSSGENRHLELAKGDV